jgi:hypothetical protein
MRRTRKDVIQGLIQQSRFMRTSCVAFDVGEEWEAVRIANAAWIILRDGLAKKTTSKSILTQLGVRGSLRFLSSGAPINPGNLASSMPLVLINVVSSGGETTAKYLPLLGNGPPIPPRLLQFPTWWEEGIYRDQKKRTLSRKNLIASMRDQDGGSHFDEELRDPTYIGVVKEGSAGWWLTSNAVTRSIEPGPHLATVRQIGWELEQTLNPLIEELSKEL